MADVAFFVLVSPANVKERRPLLAWNRACRVYDIHRIAKRKEKLSMKEHYYRVIKEIKRYLMFHCGQCLFFPSFYSYCSLSLRSGITFVSGIFTYAVTLILLNTDDRDESISAGHWKDFLVSNAPHRIEPIITRLRQEKNKAVLYIYLSRL